MLQINGREVEAERGRTALEVIRLAGWDVPTLCHAEGLPAQTSCFLCVVEVEGREALQPACALPVEGGMVLRTDSEAVVRSRRGALELLFSDHAGRCVASCATACPAGLDVPVFFRLVEQGRPEAAVALARVSLVLPAILGRLCAGYCEKACVRKSHDAPLAIRRGHGRLAESLPWDPAEGAHSTGGAAAVIGAGPAGIAAASLLGRAGLAVRLFDAAARPGGLLLRVPEARLSASLRDREIAEALASSGVDFEGGFQCDAASLQVLRERYGAVVLAVGGVEESGKEKRQAAATWLEAAGVDLAQADRRTGTTGQRGIFVAGECLRGESSLVHAIASGLAAARSAKAFLQGGEARPRMLHFVSRNAPADPPLPKDATPQQEDDRAEAARCLQCSCISREDCRLRDLGTALEVKPGHYRGESREMEPDWSHPEIVFDAGKCILCGLCLEVARQDGLAHGVAFRGRGFPTRVTPALRANIREALDHSGAKCARLCPTGALAFRDDRA